MGPSENNSSARIRKTRRFDIDGFDETAPQLSAVGDPSKRQDPSSGKVIVESPFTFFERWPIGVIFCQVSQGALNPNELPARIAALIEIIGVDEARPVVIGLFADGRQKCIIVRHLRKDSLFFWTVAGDHS